jgi:energy-coupling factor transport system ATP-binding protein
MGFGEGGRGQWHRRPRLWKPLAPFPNSGGTAIVKITDLYFRYKKAVRPVFEGFHLEVSAGERVAVLGPSESGKSTLALCLAALIPRMIKGEFRGRVEVAGCNTLETRPRQLAGRLGTLFQDFEAQLFCTRVDLEVAFGPENLGRSRTELKRRVRQCLALVGLKGMSARDPASLSGGQKQLLALAAVLGLGPRLLVLDEPTTDLDPLRVDDLLATLDRLCRQQGLTLVLLGEDLRLARFAGRIILLDRGRVAADGPPAQVLREVEAIRRLGLRPPELPALFHDLGQTDLPLTLEEALVLAERLGWTRKPLKEGCPPPPAPPLLPQDDSAPEFPPGAGPNSSPPPVGGAGGGGEITSTPKASRSFIPSHQSSGPGTGPGPEILALRRINFAYPGAAPIFKGFSLSFSQGEVTAILGPNGSGKTTLLKLLRGLLPPDAGALWTASGDQPLRVGFVFQNPDYQLFAEQVREEVAFGPRLLGLDPEEVQGRVESALKRVHLLDLAEEDPFSLTKGQRQRLAVASVLALAPQVIILDEPTTGLDYREQRDLMDLVRELHLQGHTIILVTHTMWVAAAYAQRLVLLQDGKVVLDGPTREVLAQEEVLSRCRLKPPAVLQLSQRLGFVALTTGEFRGEIGRRLAG